MPPEYFMPLGAIALFNLICFGILFVWLRHAWKSACRKASEREEAEAERAPKLPPPTSEHEVAGAQAYILTAYNSLFSTELHSFTEIMLSGPDSYIQIAMDEIDHKVLARALVPVSEELREVFFSNMNEKAAQLVRDEIEVLARVAG